MSNNEPKHFTELTEADYDAVTKKEAVKKLVKQIAITAVVTVAVTVGVELALRAAKKSDSED